MFSLIDGGFNLYIEEIVNTDISWLTTTVSLVAMNILLTIRRFGVWCKQIQKATDKKTAEKILAKVNK